MFCEHCPNKDKDGCPAWISPETGIVEANSSTGEVRVMEGCFYQIIPKLMAHVIQASNRPAAAVESIRNQLHEDLTGFGRIVTEALIAEKDARLINGGE